jgi:hypothetical protein
MNFEMLIIRSTRTSRLTTNRFRRIPLDPSDSRPIRFQKMEHEKATFIDGHSSDGRETSGIFLDGPSERNRKVCAIADCVHCRLQEHLPL